MTNSIKTISVVIPVFNRSRAAMRSVQSALAQTGLTESSLEVVVVDDASSPQFEFSSRRPDCTRIVRLNANGGPAAARNAGIRASSANYIAFLDSDDVWLPDKLSAQLALLTELEAEGTQRPTVVACGFYYPNRQSHRLEARTPIPGRSPIEFASGCWASPGTTLLAPRRVFEQVGMYDEGLRRLEDYDWLLRFGLLGGRLEVAGICGAIIAPSGLARPGVVDANIAQLRAKFGNGGDHTLDPSLRRRFDAYIALERGGANLLDGNTFTGAGGLLRSMLLRPRRTAALLPFWRRSNEVPDEVAFTYQTMRSEV